MKKLIPICAFVLLVIALILTLLNIQSLWAGGEVHPLVTPLVGVATALFLYLAIREPKETTGRTSLIVMLGISVIFSIVNTIWWAIR